MEVLAEALDNGSTVSARWLATQCGLSVPGARELLEEYKKEHVEVCANYIVSGVRGKISTAFSVVLEKGVDDAKKHFDKVCSVHIYSLNREALEQAKLSISGHTADLEQAENCLWATHDSSNAFVTNKMGAIKLAKGVHIKPPGERALVSTSKLARGVKGNSSNSSSNSSGNSSGNSSSNSSSSSFSNGNRKGNTPVRQSKSSTTSAASFFGGGGSSVKPSVQRADASQKKLPFQTSAAKKDEQSHKAATGVAEPVGPDDDEEEFDDGSGVQHRADKEKLKSRPVAHGMPIGEGGLHQDDIEVDDGVARAEGKENCATGKDGGAADSSDEGVAKGKKRKGKEALGPIHGAMDDYREDAAIAAAQANAGKKRMKTIMTEKLTMDEKGFMVKTMVKEEVTDDEADATPQSPVPKAGAKPKTNAPKTSSPARAKPKKGPTKAVSAGQKTLGAFFGKK